MSHPGEFAQVARYLTHPLVLVGFALSLVFGTFKLIITSGIVPKVDQQGGVKVIQELLFYGFFLILSVITLGLSLKYYEIQQSTIGFVLPVGVIFFGLGLKYYDV